MSSMCTISLDSRMKNTLFIGISKGYFVSHPVNFLPDAKGCQMIVTVIFIKAGCVGRKVNCEDI